MTSTSQDTNIEIKSFLIRLQEKGQINVPQVVQDYLNVTEGDTLTLLQVGIAEGGVPLILLTPKHPQVPQLTDKIVALMEEEGVALSDLLEGIETERQTIWQEQQQNA